MAIRNVEVRRALYTFVTCMLPSKDTNDRYDRYQSIKALCKIVDIADIAGAYGNCSAFAYHKMISDDFTSHMRPTGCVKTSFACVHEDIGHRA
jgi:hypothetical protein